MLKMEDMAIDFDEVKANGHLRAEGEYRGFKYILRWNESFGWCGTFDNLTGYVLIPAEHNLFKLHYSEAAVREIDVHGDITFADVVLYNGSLEWAIGYDTGHYRDQYRTEVLHSTDFGLKSVKRIIDQLLDGPIAYDREDPYYSYLSIKVPEWDNYDW